MSDKLAVRYFDTGNREEMRLLREIVADKRVRRFMADLRGMSDRDVWYWAQEKGEDASFMLAVTKLNGSREQIGKLKGFVYFTSDEDDELRIDWVRKLHMLDRPEKEGWVGKGYEKIPVFEFSLAKHPQTEKGLMAQAARIAFVKLAKYLKIWQEGEVPPLMIVGYTDRENKAMQRVNEKIGMKRVVGWRKTQHGNKRRITGIEYEVGE